MPGYFQFYDKLDDFEKARNETGPDRVFVGSKHPAYTFFIELYATVSGKRRDDFDFSRTCFDCVRTVIKFVRQSETNAQLVCAD